MNRSTWKGHERQVAKYFGTQRNPLSGGNAKHSRSDSLHADLYLELKSGKSVPKTWKAINRLYIETEEKAGKEGKYAVVVLKPAGTSAPISEWTGYIRYNMWSCGHVIAVPLWIIKELYDDGVAAGHGGHYLFASTISDAGHYLGPIDLGEVNLEMGDVK